VLHSKKSFESEEKPTDSTGMDKQDTESQQQSGNLVKLQLQSETVTCDVLNSLSSYK
jgi:hypothetical protein